MASKLASLSDWAAKNITSLFDSGNHKFQANFDSFIGPGANVILNGRTVSRSEYQSTLSNYAKALHRGVVSVQILDTIECLPFPNDPTSVRYKFCSS